MPADEPVEELEIDRNGVKRRDVTDETSLHSSMMGGKWFASAAAFVLSLAPIAFTETGLERGLRLSSTKESPSRGMHGKLRYVKVKY